MLRVGEVLPAPDAVSRDLGDIRVVGCCPARSCQSASRDDVMEPIAFLMKHDNARPIRSKLFGDWDAGCGSGTRRLRRKIPLLFGKESLKTVCFDSFILKQALKQTRSVCLRAS